MSTLINRDLRIFSLREVDKIHDAAFLTGRIKQAEEDAKILREQLAEATRPDQRMTLAIAIRAIERGRNLTNVEKMKNLMDAMAEFDREEADRLRAEGEGEPK